MQVISKELSAIIRQLVSTCRVVVVWAVGLILYHFDTDLGESWDKWSYMQLGAFVVLVSGTLLYVQSRAPPAPAADETTVLTKSLNNNVMASSRPENSIALVAFFFNSRCISDSSERT
jgi:hypothetical protein